MGGKEINKHASKKSQVVNGYRDIKTPVIDLRQKDGTVITQVVSFVSRKVVEKIMYNNVCPSAVIVTDAHTVYNLLKVKFTHIVVNHSKGEYVKNGFHTNGIENFWSHLKRGIYGIYHQVSVKHLHRYCDEFAGRYNTRTIKDNERFELSIQNSEGRLTYKNLIK